MKLLIALLAMIVCTPGCTAAHEDSPEMKISVSAKGEIEVDGKPFDLPGLKVALARLKTENGTVLYYRENPVDVEPHPNAMAVIAAIADARLPISLSSKPDFSTVVLPDGTTRRRE